MEPIDETIGTEILDFVSEVQAVSIPYFSPFSNLSDSMVLQKYDTLKVESRVFALTLRIYIHGMSHRSTLILTFPMVSPCRNTQRDGISRAGRHACQFQHVGNEVS